MASQPSEKAYLSVDSIRYREHFRVAIFGSARIQKGDKYFKQVFNLARWVGKYGYDLVTGGGPGLMEAANAGHERGDKRKKGDSIGLTIRLPKEQHTNPHVELEKHFERFSSRLDYFMDLSDVVVVTPGGIGTCLELFYSWQLIQVGHIKKMPIILIGSMWKKLIDWIKKYPLKLNLMNADDLNFIHVVRNNKEAFEIIQATYEKYKKEQKKKI